MSLLRATQFKRFADGSIKAFIPALNAWVRYEGEPPADAVWVS